MHEAIKSVCEWSRRSADTLTIVRNRIISEIYVFLSLQSSLLDLISFSVGFNKLFCLLLPSFIIFHRSGIKT